MRSVEIEYFASLREEAGLSREFIHSEARTYGELYEELRAKHAFSLPIAMMQIAVNDTFTQFDHEVVDGARVVFIPPIAGG